MRLSFSVALFLTVALPGFSPAGEKRVGQIFIAGNTTVPQSVILREIPFYPGQRLDPCMLTVAERNLARLGYLFQTEGENRPTVKVLDPDDNSEFKTILVSVSEQPDAWRFLAVADVLCVFRGLVDPTTRPSIALALTLDGLPWALRELRDRCLTQFIR